MTEREFNLINARGFDIRLILESKSGKRLKKHEYYGLIDTIKFRFSGEPAYGVLSPTLVRDRIIMPVGHLTFEQLAAVHASIGREIMHGTRAFRPIYFKVSSDGKRWQEPMYAITDIETLEII